MSADQATATGGPLGLSCRWCGEPFDAKTVGANTKAFCASDCKGEFHTALRKWAQRALKEGQLSITDLRAQ